MKTTKEIGDRGEALAVEWLKQQGYEILEQNWRFRRAEVDIICKIEGILVFIEVKTRSYDYYGTPDASINNRKETFLLDAANRYMELINYDWEIRFDVISIILSKKGEHQMKHFKDAFFGGL